nr:MAG TPA: hypothetical protein [Bacteriophage sp.]
MIFYSIIPGVSSLLYSDLIIRRVSVHFHPL